MFTVSALVLTFSLFISCEAGVVDTLPQCSIKDSECIKGMYQHMMEIVGSNGIKELGILPVDPLPVNDISVTSPNGVTFKISEGAMKGLKNCVFNDYNIDLEKERKYINIKCEVLFLEGQFIVSGENPEIQSIIGSNTLNGEGRAKVKLDNTNLIIEVPIYLTKRDGDIYLVISNQNRKFTYDTEKAHFVVEKIIIANNDLSEIVSSYLNDNWRRTMKRFGSVFIDKALESFTDTLAKFSDEIPTSKYFSEDLNLYLKH